MMSSPEGLALFPAMSGENVIARLDGREKLISDKIFFQRMITYNID